MTESTDATFATLHAAVKSATGARLFTVTVLDRKAGLGRRAYTSHPLDYPVSGTKPLGHDDWRRTVIDQGQSFVANTTKEFSPYFPDHALINALGCHSAMNIPVSDGAQVVGTVNLLDAEGHFTLDRVKALESLVETHRPALLAAFASVPMEA